MTPNYYQPYRINFTDPNSHGYVKTPDQYPLQWQSEGYGNPVATKLFNFLFGDQINAIRNANPVQETGFTPRFYPTATQMPSAPTPTPTMPAANVSQPIQQYNMAGPMPYGLLGGGFGNGFGGTYGGMQFSPQTGTMQPIQTFSASAIK
jgi:hypothetical protein